MEKEYKYTVCTRCYTYNHAPYIVDAMNGFAMQETTFPVVTLIVDDASTDGEQKVIQQYLKEYFVEPYRTEETEYAKIICAKHNTNKNCEFVVFLLKYNHHSIKKAKKPYLSEWGDNTKYLALCEGDDFWTDPLKLQKQVNFMESNPEMSFCFTANTRLTTSGEGKENRMLSEDSKSCSFEDYIVSEYDNIDTCTMMYKTPLLLTLPEWYRKVGVGDIPSKLILFCKGNVGYINNITACYRLGAISSWSVRMRNNHKMRCDNQKRILQMWRDFDAWTEKRYHKFIMKKIYVLRKRYIKSEIVLFLKSFIKEFSNGK